jgi:predicted negative regulator of RcsB-dependent stress response
MCGRDAAIVWETSRIVLRSGSLAKKKIKLNAKDVQKSVRKSEETVKVPQQLMSWVQARRQWFLGIGIGLLMALVMVWGFSSYEQVRERRAQMQYAHTLGKLASRQNPDAQAWAPLIAELKSLCEQYRGTRVARTAQVDLAQAYLVTGQYDQAVAWDLKNLRDLKANPAAQMIARHRLVMSYRAMDKLDEALAECTALQGLTVPGFNREVQWLMGQLFAAKHDHDKAAEHFQKALELEGTFPADGIIQAGLAQLRQTGGPEA